MVAHYTQKHIKTRFLTPQCFLHENYAVQELKIQTSDKKYAEGKCVHNNKK